MIRYPAVAGAFYPADPEELKKTIGSFLAQVPVIQIKGRLRALIVPHAGYFYSGPVAAYGYKLFQNAKFRFQKFILLGPAHTVGFEGVAVSTAETWETPLGSITTWQPKKIIHPFIEFDLAHLQEHCLEVQLPFLQVVLNKKFQIFPLVAGKVNPEKLASAFDKMIEDENFIIVSSDFSHYHTYSTAKDLDQLTIEAILKNQMTILETQGEACGLQSIIGLLYLAQKKGWQARLLDYRNSGDTAGDKSRVVGYAAIAFIEE